MFNLVIEEVGRICSLITNTGLSKCWKRGTV